MLTRAYPLRPIPNCPTKGPVAAQRSIDFARQLRHLLTCAVESPMLLDPQWATNDHFRPKTHRTATCPRWHELEYRANTVVGAAACNDQLRRPDAASQIGGHWLQRLPREGCVTNECRTARPTGHVERWTARRRSANPPNRDNRPVTVEPSAKPPAKRPGRKPIRVGEWGRFFGAVLGLIGVAAGGWAVFKTDLEAGPVALLLLGTVFLLIHVTSRTRRLEVR